MKPHIYFIAIASLTYCIFSIYLLRRAWQATPRRLGLRWLVILIGILCFGSLFYSLLSTGNSMFWLQSLCSHISGTWLMVLLYLGGALLSIDIFKLVGRIFKIESSWSERFRRHARIVLFWGGLSLTAILLLGAAIKYHNPTVQHYSSNIYLDTSELQAPIDTLFQASSSRTRLEKTFQKDTLTIVFASDLHLGYLNGRKATERFVEQIMAQKPDLILLGGDIIDRQLEVVKYKHLNIILNRLHAPLGVYAVLGNHDHMGRKSQELRTYLNKCNIRVLDDQYADIHPSFALMGRRDASQTPRLSTDEICQSLSKATIIMDHQPPSDLQVLPNVFLYLSGHTHRGQVWPITHIVDQLYPLSHGHSVKGNTQYIVSSGLGIWGGPYRIGSESEIVVIKLY